MSNSARLLAEARRLRPRKSFAQHFLVDEGIVEGIVALGEPNAQETALEIGAGGGFLTEAIAPGVGHLIALEIDPKMLGHLQAKFAGVSNLEIHDQDILKLDWASFGEEKLLVYGNLPYQITSPILFHLFGELGDTAHAGRQRIRRAVLMVQKEVAERLTAQPGSRAYGQLTLMLQFWNRVSWGLDVPRDRFFPAPQVDSAVVVVEPREGPALPDMDPREFSRWIKAAFAQRRKTLVNNWGQAGLAEKSRIAEALIKLELPADVRGEAVSLEQYGALWHALAHA